MTDPTASPAEPLELPIPGSQQIVPTLAEIAELLPEAGRVFLDLALEKWKGRIMQQHAMAQQSSQQRQIDMLRAALLSHGVDPLTLRPPGESPEVAAHAEANGTGAASPDAHD